MKKSTIWIVLLCLIFCLAGCDSNTPVQTTLPTTTPTTEAPTEPAPDAAEVYRQAMELLGTDAVGMNLDIDQTMTVGGQKFTSSSMQKVRYWNIGTEDFVAQVEDSTDLVEHFYAVNELYSNGNIYMEVNDCLFTAEMEAEDYSSRYPGTQLLDPALYTLSISDDGKTISFTEATALESWIAPEEAELIHAEATLTISEENKPRKLDLTVEYIYGNASFDITYVVYYYDPGEIPAMPENPEEYITVTDIDGMWLSEVAYGYMLQSKQYTARSVSTMQSQAAGFLVNRQENLNAYNTGKSVDYLIETSIYAMDSSGDFQQETTDKFIDGKYTFSADGGEEQPNGAVSSYVMETAATGIMTNGTIATSYLSNAEITSFGSVILVEYTCNEEAGETMQDFICEEYFGGADAINDLASAYKTNVMDYYVALESYTLLPTAWGYLYEGAHTIEGNDYILMEQVDISMDMASLTSHETIYEEPMADVEPEEKPTPLFYHVTGDEGQEMWLFGTIHVGDDRTAFLPQEIYDALLSSVALAVECDSEGFDQQMEEDESLQSKVSALYYYSDGPISEHLDTEDLYEDAKKALKATGGYFYNSDYQKASSWSSSIDNFYLAQGRKLVREKGIESRLERIAKENEIPLWEVESSLFQLQMLLGFSDNLQEFQLYSSVYSNGKDSWESTQELFELWCAGDEAALIEELARESWEITEEDLAEMEAQEDLTDEDREEIQKIRENMETINKELEKIRKEYIAAMETDRNLGMLNKAIEYLESGETVFYAVGLAHLLAEDGLVTTLREAGYTVELVTYQ